MRCQLVPFFFESLIMFSSCMLSRDWYFQRGCCTIKGEMPVFSCKATWGGYTYMHTSTYTCKHRHTKTHTCSFVHTQMYTYLITCALFPVLLLKQMLCFFIIHYSDDAVLILVLFFVCILWLPIIFFVHGWTFGYLFGLAFSFCPGLMHMNMKHVSSCIFNKF